MANYLTTDAELTSVANAIRTKGGTQADLVYPTGFVNAIGAISGVVMEEKTGSDQWFESFTNQEVFDAVNRGNGTLYCDLTFSITSNQYTTRLYASPSLNDVKKLVLSYNSRNTNEAADAGINIVVILTIIPALSRVSVSNSILYMGATGATIDSRTYTFIYHPISSS